MMMVGPKNFIKVGQEFRGYFVEMAGLQPDHKVLDIGCGAGRMAIPLTEYLSDQGGYWGFDNRPDVIEWCQDHISAKHKNFHFVHGDVYHERYNPDGKLQAQEFKFPFDDGSFDLIFLISVFTHMLPSDTESYTREISRVLKPGGKCFITYFLITDDPKSLNRSSVSNLDFIHQGKNYRTPNKSNPESAVGYDAKYIEHIYQANNLKIDKFIKYGDWSGRDDYLGSQDIVIAKKK
ncbi:MAG: class I SAM-dependent methyltransferase [Anaerolineales bacterium]|nr:class I SAM-dependent methyltransferase [Anaerolineales bacterium]